MMENHVCPGELIFGADSHTCAYGALGAFGTGVGCTDYLYAMVTGKSWVLVPETLRFNLTGKLPEGVYASDLILTIIGKIGANGANYKAMEFAGDGLKNLTMSDRIAICNLCVRGRCQNCSSWKWMILPLIIFMSMAASQRHALPAMRMLSLQPLTILTCLPSLLLLAKPHFVDNVCPAREAARHQD